VKVVLGKRVGKLQFRNSVSLEASKGYPIKKLQLGKRQAENENAGW